MRWIRLRDTIDSNVPMLGRLRRALTGRISVEECELAINKALHEMKRNQIANREHVVGAISARDAYRSQFHHAMSECRRIERRLRKPKLSNGETAELLRLQLEKQRLMAEAVLPKLRETEVAVERIKCMIRKEEERFRVSVAKALAAKALIEAEVCVDKLKHLRDDASRNYPELQAD